MYISHSSQTHDRIQIRRVYLKMNECLSWAGAIYIKHKYQVESYIILVIQSHLWGWFRLIFGFFSFFFIYDYRFILFFVWFNLHIILSQHSKITYFFSGECAAKRISNLNWKSRVSWQKQNHKFPEDNSNFTQRKKETKKKQRIIHESTKTKSYKERYGKVL